MSHHVFLLFGQARAFLLRRWRTDDGDTVSMHVLPANMDAAGQHVELSFLQPLRMVSLPLGAIHAQTSAKLLAFVPAKKSSTVCRGLLTKDLGSGCRP